MLKGKGQTNNGKSIPLGLALGIGTSMAVTLLGAALIAWLISAEKAGEGSTDLLTCCIHVIASVTGAWMASAVVKKMRLQICLFTGLGYYLTLLAVTALVFDGAYTSMGLTALLVAGGSVLTALIPKKKSLSFTKKKHAYR